MKKCLVVLIFLFLVACQERVEESLPGTMTVTSPLSLEGASGVVETIGKGRYLITLDFRSGSSSVGGDGIVLSVEGGGQFAFERPSKKFLEFATGDGFEGIVLAEDSGWPYDIRLTHVRKTFNGSLQLDDSFVCLELGSVDFPPRSHLSQVHYYNRFIDDHYRMTFLRPDSSDGGELATIEIFNERVERVDVSDTSNCF